MLGNITGQPFSIDLHVFPWIGHMTFNIRTEHLEGTQNRYCTQDIAYVFVNIVYDAVGAQMSL